MSDKRRPVRFDSPSDPVHDALTDAAHLAGSAARRLTEALTYEVEQSIQAVLRPRPWWLPERLWRKVVARVVAVDFHGTTTVRRKP